MRKFVFSVFAVFLSYVSADEPNFENPILHAKKFEGDIDGVENPPTSQPAINSWPGGLIPFMVDENLDHATMDMLFRAITAYKSKTCIKFIPAKSNHRNYIYFKNGATDEGCYSKVGRQGGRQEVVLETECAGVGTILHLLMHVLGFFHESARIDRDQYVTVVWNNIAENNKKHFGKYIRPYEGQNYDYQSITHLPKNAFAKNPRSATITQKTGGQLPDHEGLSEGDLAKINHKYCQGWARDAPSPNRYDYQADQGCARCRRSMSRKDKKTRDRDRDRDRRRGNAADRHHERHGHGHGASGHGHRGNNNN